MFNIGFGELAVICIVLIIAVGPERLPSMMKTLGKTLRTLRQASRDIRASTGIDEMMREDFDLYAPIKPNPPRRPALIAAAEEPAALPATTEASVPITPAANVADQPKPVSREEIIEDVDRPSVVVAPPPQAIGLPSDEPALSDEPQPSAAVTEVSAPAPQLTAAADPSTLPRESTPPPPVRAPREDTLPRAPIQAVPPSPDAQTAQTAQPEPQPQAADDEELAKNGSASSEPKQSGA
jgi:sec-independent protein translocase protein TatB